MNRSVSSRSKSRKSKTSKPKQKKSFIENLQQRRKSWLSRRPHRSFVRTRRRDYKRSLVLPGYISFTKSVVARLFYDKWLLARLIALSSIISAILVSFASQSAFTDFIDTLNQQGGDLLNNGWGGIARIGILFIAGTTGRFDVTVDETQQIYAGIIALLTWLTTVWILRAQLAGNRPRLRDGLYNAGSPIVATFLLFLLLIVQFIPLAIAIIIYTSAGTTGILDMPLLSMLAFFFAITLSVLSLYLATSTFMALVIVTLPGMYPWNALRSAGDLVTGRRLRILRRILWCFFVVALVWLAILVPAIIVSYFIYAHVKFLIWLPIVPLAILLLSSTTTVFVSAYIYLLYRKVVDSDAA